LILVDANILLYAEDSLSALHRQARSWWDTQLSGTDPVCLSWVVVSAYIRIGTNPRVFQHPLSLPQALARVQCRTSEQVDSLHLRPPPSWGLPEIYDPIDESSLTPRYKTLAKLNEVLAGLKTTPSK